MQASRSSRVSSAPISRYHQGFTQKIEENSKRRASVLSLALNTDPAAMEIEQSFRNSQAETQSPKLSGNGRFALVESLEDATLPFSLNANAGIADFEYKLPSLIR